MGSTSLIGILTISQYSLFLGIGLIFFSWVEKKERLALAGQAIIVLLGFLSLWVLLTNTIVVPEVNENSISKELKILSYFKISAFFAVFSLISILLSVFKFRYHKLSVYLVVFIGLSLFFMVFSILRMPK